MFKRIKKSLGLRDLHEEIVEEIDGQKEIIKKTLKVSASDEANIIIKEATLTQAVANIDALATSLNQYMTKFHNTELTARGIEKYLKKELPIECKGFVYNINVRGYKRDLIQDFYFSEGLLYGTEKDLERFYDYLDFWKGSKFNNKFSKLYADKVRTKAIALLREVDDGCANYIETTWLMHGNLTTFLQTLIEHVEFYFIVKNSLTNKNTEKLPILVMNYARDNLAIEMVKHCDNFGALVFAEKEAVQ